MTVTPISSSIAGLRSSLDGRGVHPANRADILAEEQALLDEQSAKAAAARWNAAIPLRFRPAMLATVDQPEPTLGEMVAYAQDPRGNVLLLGPTGVGKTYAAVAMSRPTHVAGRTVRFSPVGEMLDALRPDGGGRIEDYTQPDLLIMDDLGAERPTEWTGERLYLVVNRRWLEERPTIVTSNLEPDELRAALGTRTFDRLRDGAHPWRLSGESRRRQA